MNKSLNWVISVDEKYGSNDLCIEKICNIISSINCLNLHLNILFWANIYIIDCALIVYV